MRIIEKIERAIGEKRIFYSFEYFPPKTEAGLFNLYARIERMARLLPEFVDVTWGAGGSTARRSLEIAAHTQNFSGLDTMLHLTCTGLSKKKILEILRRAESMGITNILALRGDPPRGEGRWRPHPDGLSYASDLVAFIRDNFGGRFGIAVAGYPEGHKESPDYRTDLRYLKKKVDAGADFIITQLFYDAEIFIRFVNDCREIGIDCPIIPGIMPVQTYNMFRRMRRYCKFIPSELIDEIERVKNDDSAVRERGNRFVADMCRQILDAEAAPGLHFYTMNLEKSVTWILQDLKLIPEELHRTLPWLIKEHPLRPNEEVRPIFWANRPKSYIARTMEWDEFPNGRWGDSRSPAFGELNDYYMARLHLVPRERRAMWGESPSSEEDIREVFVKFCRGEIDAIPWFDSPLALESDLIREELIFLNQNGLLTINSQPRVNGARSEDPVVGWGGPGGRVYQKAYVEFFISSEDLKPLLRVFQKYSPRLTFHAINREGLSYTNCERVNAVTWGVFPGKEIIQPTVVDPDAFVVWKDEAFSLWLTAWASIYPPESHSRKLIERICNTYFLVNVVDNDFIEGNIWDVFREAIEEIERDRKIRDKETA